VTEHLKTFGAIEIPKRRYHRLLEEALSGEGDFAALPVTGPISGQDALAILGDPK
jgi:leucyl/phenylalanyl-tRNA--protein transferase